MLPLEQQTPQTPIAGLTDRFSILKPPIHLVYWIELLIVVSFNIVLLGITTSPLPDTVKIAVSNVAGWLGPLLVVPFCFWGVFQSGQSAGVHSSDGISSRFWSPALLGIGVLSFSVGEFLWMNSFNATRKTPDAPSWPDLFYLLTYPFLLSAILYLPARRIQLAQRTRILVDGLIIMTALVVFSWYFLLGPNLIPLLQPSISVNRINTILLNSAYPCADLVLLICVLLLSIRADIPGLIRTPVFLIVGLFSIIIADSIHGFRAIQHIYIPGTVLDTGSTLGYMLVGLAALNMSLEANRHPHTAHSDPAIEIRLAPVVWKSLTPYLLVLAVGGLVFYALKHKGDEQLESGIYIGAAVLVLLIVVRQVLTIRENSRLYHSLHDAYRELEEKNKQALDYAARLEQLNDEMHAMQTELIKNNQELVESKTLWERLAVTDTMTEIANHRAFQERLRTEIARAHRYSYSFILLMLDVDMFKHYNDTYGHPAGDQVLREIAALMREAVREGDLVARYGGEEFAALLTQTDVESARVVADRIREVVEGHSFSFRRVTLSIGAAEYPRDGSDPETLIESADKALYAAKHSGRNRVIFFKNIGQGPQGGLRD